MELGNILACLELGYLYGTMEAREKDADRCFNQVEESKSTIITFKNRITESMVQMRVNRISCSNNYLEEINDMKLAAGITYTFYNMERQAFDWFQEISYLPLARIMILYYKMKDLEQRTPDAITLLSDLMSPFEIEDKLSHYGRMSLSYGQFRLGQCYEHGHGVSVDFIKAGEYYMKACANLQNDEIYERLAEMPIKRDPEFEVQLFTVLRNASRNDIDAVFRLARFYHAMEVNLEDPDVPSSKAAEHYRNAAKQRHAKSCYYYAKYRIHQLQQCIPLKAAQNSKTAVDYLEIAAKKNHGPSFYELGKLKMATGLFEEGIEDLEEADFLGCAAASYRLGELYLQGFSGTVKGYTTTYHLSPKLNEAYRYFYRAHEQNLPLATIQLGHFFETGAFGEQNLSKARSYYMRVLESRQYCEGAAEYALGCLEETYLSVSSQPNANKHRQNAFDWFKRSKDAQNKQANFKIGCYLLHGWVLQDTADKDIKDGIKKLEEEHANSNVQATKELARYYQDQNNNKQAIYYWCKARDMNDAEALEFLAQCFEKGLLGQDVNMENAARYKAEAMDARKYYTVVFESMLHFCLTLFVLV
jgi:TPR repeat protein